MKTQEQKINYLKELLEIYLKFSKHYNAVDVWIENNELNVKWFNPKQKDWYTFELIQCNIEDIDKRILSYKSKVNYAYKNRHGKVN